MDTFTHSFWRTRDIREPEKGPIQGMGPPCPLPLAVHGLNHHRPHGPHPRANGLNK